MVYHFHTPSTGPVANSFAFCIVFILSCSPSRLLCMCVNSSFFFFVFWSIPVQSPMVIPVFIYMHCIKWDLFPQYDSDLFFFFFAGG